MWSKVDYMFVVPLLAWLHTLHSLNSLSDIAQSQFSWVVQ